MMIPDHYRDFHLTLQAEIPAPAMMSRLFQNLHRGIMQFGVGRIAVSFPEANATLGTILRLHGNQNDLEAFGTDWVRSLKRMVTYDGIEPSPTKAALKTIRRVRVDRGPAWQRRMIRRHGEDVLDNLPTRTESRTPFVHMQSSSTGQEFMMHLMMTDPPPGIQDPDSYGLGSPIPQF
jgi:CRISPR-associated endonuclease Csy4